MTTDGAQEVLPDLRTTLREADYNIAELQSIVGELAELAVTYFDIAHEASQEQNRTMPSPYEADRFGRGEGMVEALAKFAKPKVDESLRLKEDESEYSIWYRIVQHERQRREELESTSVS